MELSEEKLKEIISQAVTAAMQLKPANNEPEPESKHEKSFKKMEKLLFMYPTLKRLLDNKSEYIPTELQKRSGSILFHSSHAVNYQNDNERLEDLQEKKEIEYNKTAADVAKLEKVLDLFKDRKEYDVIKLYYFGLNPDGTKYEYSEKLSWFDVSMELGITEKTARRWRNILVSEMSVCMFGIDEAL